MNKFLLHIICVCIPVLLVGCSESGHLSGEDVPSITFDMSLDQTKALISPENLNTAGSKMLVYDVYTSEQGPSQYLDAQYMEYGNGLWNFTKTSGGEVIRIPWTKKGTHDFFAYNVHDASANMSLPVDVSYSYSTAKQQTVRVPESGEWTLNLNNQFDFIYGFAARNVETDGYAALPINFKHLFAAVAVEVKNASTEHLKLSGLSFSNIKDEGFAEVKYGGDVQYSLSASKATGLFPAISNDVTVALGGSTVLYNDLGAGQSFLIWPHSAGDLANAAISITYKLGSNINSVTATVNLTENYTVKNWLAGNKYKYLIAITDNNISCDVIKVVDWINDDVILEE